MSFFEELKRRNVVKVGLAYLVGSWLLIQVADVVFDSIGSPGWVMQTLLAVLAIGFLLALFFAWAFELTPEGVKREAEIDRSQSITAHTGKKLNNSILVLMALAIAYLLFDKFSAEKPGSIETSAVLTQQNVQQQPDPSLEPAATISRQSIAVLPFDNRSRNVDDEYFTEGIHDDLLTNLARISSLKVISRTSVNRYKESNKSIPEIAAELGVATVMEGAVQRSGSTVRINVQLIDAKTDEHLWAEIFDRELTAENLFAIQSEISEKIADALEAALSPEEEKRINEFPTQSMEAYNAYLRGRQLLPQRNSEDLGQAMESFELAVKIDPEFALAWVGIAESAVLLAAYSTLNPDVRNEIMESAIKRALEINPDLGEAYASKGSLLDDLNQDEQAETAYQRAIELSPNYATAYLWYELLISNYNNRLPEALDIINKAEQLDPLSPIIKNNKAALYQQMGRFEEAESAYKQLVADNPEFTQGMLALGAGLYGRGLGRLDDGIILLQKARKVDSGNIFDMAVEYIQWLRLNDDESAQSVYQQMEDLDAGHYWLPITRAFMNIKNGRYAAAKEQALFLAQKFQGPAQQRWAGLIFARSGHYDQAREYLLKVDPRYLDREQWANVLNEETPGPSNPNACIVGLTLARTGDEALGYDLLRYAASYWEQTAPLYTMHADRFPIFECHAYLGDIEKSLAALETSLAHKHVLHDWVFIAANAELRLLHEDPRFKAMDQQVMTELTRQRENLAQRGIEAGH